MRNKKGIFLLSLTVFAISFGAIQNAQAQSAKCFSNSEVTELSSHFAQLKGFLTTNAEVCEDQMGPEWTKIVESLLDLKHLTLAESTPFKTQDAFSHQSIPNSGWWDYYTNRTNDFSPQGFGCSEGVIAFVMRFMPGTVHLCPPFYELDRPGRMEVLLHEVRHFDGFSHVTCSRGSDKGSTGACDEKLEDSGSYAVSMQSSITLGMNGKDFSKAERALARANALSLLHNKFNEETDVKTKQSLYLENPQGEVFEWDAMGSGELRFITKLESPALIFSASIETILYPLDKSVSAYRMSEDFTSPISRLGMFAETYNGKSVAERSAYRAVGYNGIGGFIKSESVTFNCGFQLQEKPMSSLPEVMKNYVTLEQEGQSLRDYLVGESGQLYTSSCEQSVVSLQAVGTIAQGVKKSAYVNGSRFALTEQGQIFDLVKSDTNYSLGAPLQSSDQWIEMTTRTMPYLFEEALGAQ